jgi:type IV secretion system protein VirD4
MPSGVLGTAAWSTDPGHWRYEPLAGQGAPVAGRFLLLGENPNIGGFLHVRAPRQHLLSIAPTRSGKGVSLIIPNLLLYEGAVLVVDPKGENAWVTAGRRRALGQKVAIVDPWGEVNRRYGAMAGKEEKSIARFNPLSILKPGTDDFVEDLGYLADALIITQSARDPYWEDTARELWAGLMAFVVENPAYAPHASLALARKLLMKSNTELARTIRTAIELGPGSVAALKLAQFATLEESTAIMSVVSAARTQTAFLDSDALSGSMDASGFSFDELCGGNISVYLVLPPDKLETYARWLRLMVSAGLRAVARGGSQSRLGLPTLFMLDEFGTIGKLNAVAQAYGLMAGLGMILWTFSQDLNQLVRDYPQHWETFIGNSQAVTCFGVMDNFTAEYISKMLGIATIEQTTVATSVGTSVGPPVLNAPIWASRTSRSTSVNYSTQTMSRPLLHPDEVRSLAGDRCLIMGNFPPILSRRIVYHEDWDLLHCSREDPHFPRTEQVRWRALQRRLHEMGSVARLLKEYDFEVKGLRRGRYEVKSTDGTWTHTFPSDNELWSWTYAVVMDSTKFTLAPSSGSAPAQESGSA